MSLFPMTPKWESQKWDFCCPKYLDAHFFPQMKSFFDNVKQISYSLQKYLSNDVWHASIKPHLTLAFKEFVVKNQNFNLTHALSFYHYSYKSGLNEQYEGTLSTYTSRPF
jgi:hypothetical protein